MERECGDFAGKKSGIEWLMEAKSLPRELLKSAEMKDEIHAYSLEPLKADSF